MKAMATKPLLIDCSKKIKPRIQPFYNSQEANPGLPNANSSKDICHLAIKKMMVAKLPTEQQSKQIFDIIANPTLCFYSISLVFILPQATVQGKARNPKNT